MSLDLKYWKNLSTQMKGYSTCICTSPSSSEDIFRICGGGGLSGICLNPAYLARSEVCHLPLNDTRPTAIAAEVAGSRILEVSGLIPHMQTLQVAGQSRERGKRSQLGEHEVTPFQSFCAAADCRYGSNNPETNSFRAMFWH
ncbi:hypothetical protein PABG_00535 [Paracoccidioides brasiliensis Pb03]|nr:hypothetical protein PABG_00535 [Paracoccidioides brasiliensis Pb03]